MLRRDRPAPGVLRLTLDVPPGRRGAMSAATHAELADVWTAVAQDDATRAVLLTASGPDFCAGGDLGEQRAALDDPALLARAVDEARRIVYGMLDCPTPVVTAARGWAVGAGLALLTLADVSIVADDARLADGHVAIGLVAGDHAAISWPLLCGAAKAKYHLLTGEPMTGAQAERMGLVALSVPDGELDARALDVATRLAASAPGAVRGTKQVINAWLRQASPIFETSLALEALGVAGPEGREGITAFLERRPPVWPVPGQA